MKNETDPLEERILLAEVVRALVDKPESVHVDEHRSEENSRMLVKVAPSDRGKVIGRNGTTVSARRALFGRIGAVEGRQHFIQVEEPRRQLAG